MRRLVKALSLATLLLSRSAFAQVAFDAAAGGNTPNGGASSVTVALTTSGSNRFLKCGAATNGNSPTATYAGVSMTCDTAVTSGLVKVYDCALVAPTTGNNNFVFTPNGDSVIAAGCISMTNVDQTTPQSARVTNTGTTSPATVNVTCSASGQMLVDIAGSQKNGASASTLTVGSGQTQRWNNAATTTLCGSDCETGAASTSTESGTITEDWTINANVAWAISASAVFAVGNTACSAGAAPQIIRQYQSSKLAPLRWFLQNGTGREPA